MPFFLSRYSFAARFFSAMAIIFHQANTLDNLLLVLPLRSAACTSSQPSGFTSFDGELVRTSAACACQYAALSAV
jgi:hypothetical protein